MTIRYTNTFRDLIAFSVYTYSRSPLLLTVLGIGVAAITYKPVVYSFQSEHSLSTKVVSFILIEAIVCSFSALLFGILLLLSLSARRNKVMLTEHVLTVADDSLVEETSYNKTTHTWTGVQRIARNRRYIFIYVMQYAAHVIPRRAFKDNTEWDSFYELCKQRIADANG